MANSKTEIIKEPKNKKEKAVIDALVEKGKKDGNPNQPKFPSAQLWVDLSPDAQAYFKEILIQTGEDWESYEREMKQHWPAEKVTVITKEISKRQK